MRAHVCALLSRYAVGVLDKASGVMRYAEVGTGNIVRMEPRARGVNYGPTGAITEHVDDRQARILQNKKCVRLTCLYAYKAFSSLVPAWSKLHRINLPKVSIPSGGRLKAIA